MRKLKTGDIVKIIAGNDKGHIGKLLNVSDRSVIVEGANIKSKAKKGEGIITFAAPLDISNVQYYDEKAQRTARIKITTAKDGNKRRTYNGASGVFI